MPGRIIYQPFAGFTGALVTASSQDLSFPVRRLRDPSPSATWRSKLGWNVSANFNDRCDFTEDGNARVALLTVGNYETGDDFAAHVQAQMNAASGVTNTYTVIYDPDDFKFTITRATGSAAVVLKFLDGANLARSVALDLGFTETNKSGSTTYTSESVAYHSREWVQVELQSAADGKVSLALNHNLLAAGTVKTQANSSASWAAPPFTSTQSISVTSPLPLRYDFFTSTQTYAFWRHVFTDVQNPDGFTEAGLLHVSGFIEPGIDFAIEWSEDRAELSEVGLADRGASFHNEKPTRTEWGLKWPALTPAEKIDFDVFLDFTHRGRPFFFAFDPDDDTSFVRYLILKVNPKWSRVPPNYWELGLAFQTVLA